MILCMSQLSRYCLPNCKQLEPLNIFPLPTVTILSIINEHWRDTARGRALPLRFQGAPLDRFLQRAQLLQHPAPMARAPSPVRHSCSRTVSSIHKPASQQGTALWMAFPTTKRWISSRFHKVNFQQVPQLQLHCHSVAIAMPSLTRSGSLP